jgi:hypothetical protein
VSAGNLDTEIPGDPGSVSTSAAWLHSTLGSGVDGGAHALRRAREEARSEWASESGHAFSTKMSTAHGKVVMFGECITAMSRSLKVFADSMHTAQNRMADIRERARANGLSVRGFVIENPGPGPVCPPDRSGVEMPVAEAEAHEADMRAYNRHQELIEAHRRAVAEVDEVRTAFGAAEKKLADDYKGMSWTDAALTGTDFASAAVLAKMSKYHAELLRADANHWSRQASGWTERMRNTNYQAYRRMEDLLGPNAPERMFDSDAAHQRYLQEQASSRGAAADAAETRGRFSTAAKNVSRGLVGVGVAVDLADGESVPQAAASNVGGYAAGAAATAAVSAGTTMLASTATGAAIGSAVPVVGTAVGAVVGAGVGVFASGAIDSLFENGPDVGTAVAEGAEAVTDTVGAVGDGFEAAGDFVGDLF